MQEISKRFDGSDPLTWVRVVSGLLFLPHVAGKLLPPHPALGFFEAVGFPAPATVMALAAFAELLACMGLVLAIQTRWAALLGASVLLVASGALLKLGGKGMWLWNLGGVEYPVFWALICLFVAWTHGSNKTPTAQAA